MKVPLSWLKEYLDLNLSPKKIADALTLAGLEVEKYGSEPISFEGVVVAKVLEVRPHPNADKLRLATVFDGQETIEVVCGAPNCRAGIKVALAKIGTVLKDEVGKTFKIKRSKIRDVESFGMLCSAKELGLSADDEGILEFSEEISEGIDVADLYSDPIFEISLTPNLGHNMSVLGLARELAAILNLKIKTPVIHVQEDHAHSTLQMIDVRIEDKTQCLRYACRVVQNVSVGPSPNWLKNRLEACGIRSINNIVDVGNYVMLQTGQPLHLFDYDKIYDKKIIVSSHTLIPYIFTLDGQKREIPLESLVVCDPKQALALAGVMGGQSSAITDHSHNVLIESAYFTPQAIRKSSKLLNLSSDSSQRFERGIDPQMLLKALDLAAELLRQVAHGQVAMGIVDIQAGDFPVREMSCRVSRVNQLLGTELTLREVAEILERLQFKIVSEENNVLQVRIPSFRNDVQIEVDLIEEVGRIYGYNNLPKISPLHISSSLSNAPMFDFERKMRLLLIEEGLQECMTCDLISPFLAELTLEKTLPKDSLISVLHPSSIDQSVLRQTLLPGLLQMVKHNLDHQNEDLWAFEVGRIHFKTHEHIVEQSVAGIVISGKKSPYHWDPKTKEVDFFDLKGMIENLLSALHIETAAFEISHLHNFHPGRQARIKVKDIYIGTLGEIHPIHLNALNIEQKVLFAELNLHDLLLLTRTDWHVESLAAYPGSKRDWTISLKEEVPIDTVFNHVKSISSHLLAKIILLDLYKSDEIGKDKKNVTFRFFYRDKQKTIDLDTVEKEHERITQDVAEKLRDCLR